MEASQELAVLSPEPQLASGETSEAPTMPPTPSGSASDEEHRALLKTLHGYVTDVRQQLTNIRVEEELKHRRAERDGDGPVETSEEKLESMTAEERQVWLADEEKRQKEEDAREEEIARQKEKELKEKLKQKARERRKEKEKVAEALKEKERQAEEQRRREEEEAEQKRKAAEVSSRPPPISIEPATVTRSDRTDSTATDSPISARSTASESVTFSAVSTLPSAVNPLLTVPTSVPSFTAAPSYALPAIPFSAIDHFTLTHIQNLLAQMWTIALSLLSSTPTKTAAWYDNQHPACLHCHQRFGLMHRRHHCRLCGGLYCGTCSSHKITIEKFGFKQVRVCATCFVISRTVVLCRKAVESGQVEYKEVVRQAEKYAENEREKARLAQLTLQEGGTVKGEKIMKVVETPRGSTTLAQITPPMSPPQPISRAAGGPVETLKTPVKKGKKDAPISPALVPFFAGGKDKEREGEAISTSSDEGNSVAAAPEVAAAVPVTAPAAVQAEAPAKVKNERMMKLIEVEREKQRALQREMDSAKPPSHPQLPVAVRRPSAQAPTPTAAAQPQQATGVSAAAKGPVKSLGLGSKAIL